MISGTYNSYVSAKLHRLCVFRIGGRKCRSTRDRQVEKQPQCHRLTGAPPIGESRPHTCRLVDRHQTPRELLAWVMPYNLFLEKRKDHLIRSVLVACERPFYSKLSPARSWFPMPLSCLRVGSRLLAWHIRQAVPRQHHACSRHRIYCDFLNVVG